MGLSNRELTDRLLAGCGADESSVEYVEDRKGHDRRYALDDAKIRAELGYAPRIGIDEGLEATIKWYRENQGWWRALKDGPHG